MGLEKEIETGTGAVGNYHRIKHIVINVQMSKAVFEVESYKDHQARIDKKRPLETKGVEIELSGDLLSILHETLKENSDFEGAIDIDPDLTPNEIEAIINLGEKNDQE